MLMLMLTYLKVNKERKKERKKEIVNFSERKEKNQKLIKYIIYPLNYTHTSLR